MNYLYLGDGRGRFVESALFAGVGSNTAGLGARLELRTPTKRQVRVVRGPSGYMSQGPAEVYFGLGAAEKADELRVVWPSGQVDVHKALRAGFLYVLTEGETELLSEPFL